MIRTTEKCWWIEVKEGHWQGGVEVREEVETSEETRAE